MQACKKKNALGTQMILELGNCPAEILSDPILIEKIMRKAASTMGATIVSSNFHHFSPLGVSGVVIIMESHLTIHTWPEYGYAAIDLFTCGTINMRAGIQYLKQQLKATEAQEKILERGLGIGK